MTLVYPRSRFPKIQDSDFHTGKRTIEPAPGVDQMAGEADQLAPQDAKQSDLDYEQARLAYSIIQSLLEHTRVVSDLIAVMAQALDEDTQRALTQTPIWTAYLDSRRDLERTRANIEKFAEMMKQMSED